MTEEEHESAFRKGYQQGFQAALEAVSTRCSKETKPVIASLEKWCGDKLYAWRREPKTFKIPPDPDF